MPSPAPLPASHRLRLKTQAAWSSWLARHHATSGGVWLELARSASGLVTVTYAEALESALCYGWIDGQKRGLDEACWLQRFTPRRPRSLWSQVNREKALALIERGLMQPSGHAAIERARADGRWAAAYSSQSKAKVPPDLQAALRECPKAEAFFRTLTSQNRYAILFRLETAKKPETRAARPRKCVAMLELGETFH